jgi:hypothetical protein
MDLPYADHAAVRLLPAVLYSSLIDRLLFIQQ